MFISFEGIDGAGKSTVFNRLKKEIENSVQQEKFVFTREPGGTKISEAIRQILISPNYEAMDPWTEAFLYAAARRQNVIEKIAPALKKSQIVIADRYVDSSLAYQGAGRGLGIKQVALINQFAIGEAIPDRIIYFKINPETALQRVNQRTQDADRFEKEQELFFKTVADAYDQLIKHHPERYLIVDSEESLEKVYANVSQEIKKLVKGS